MIPEFAAPRTELWLLVMEGDCVPVRIGPLDDDADPVDAARKHREANGDDDGPYRLFLDDDGAPVVDVLLVAEVQPR